MIIMNGRKKNDVAKDTKKFAFLRANFIVLFAFCFFLHMPKFNLPSIVMQFLSIGLPLIYVVLNFRKIKQINTRQLIALLFIIILIVLSVLYPIFHGTGDFSYSSTTLSILKKAVIFMALICLVINVHGKERTLFYFMYYFGLAHVIYVLGTLLLVSIPSLQEAWFSIADKGVMMGNYAGRLFRIGWEGFSGFRLTLYCTISVAFSLYLRYGSRIPEISARQFLFLLIGCITGNMFYGRSGLIISLIIVLIAFVYWNRNNIKRIMISIALVAACVAGIGSLRFVPGLDNWFEWMSSPIVNLITTGDMQDKSFDRLQEMQQVEIDNETFLYGDGYYNENGHYYMNTDAGFIRNILFWGIIGFVLSYGITIYSIIGLSKLSKLLFLQILIIFLAFEYKGAVYYEFISLTLAIDAGIMLLQDGQLLGRVRHE